VLQALNRNLRQLLSVSLDARDVHLSFTSTLQQQSTLYAAAKDDSNLRYFGYTRERKPRPICNVDDVYRALQIKIDKNQLATSSTSHETSPAAEQQPTQTAHIDDMPINLSVTANDSISNIHLMASIDSMPSKSSKDCDGSRARDVLTASRFFRALFDGDSDCMVHVMSPMRSHQLQPRSFSYPATSFVKSFMLTHANEGATSRSSVFEATTSFLASSDVYKTQTAKWWPHLIMLFSLFSLTLHFTRESENKSGRSLINDSNTNLCSFMKFRTSLSSFDIIWNI
jgi:hypothetical protein